MDDSDVNRILRNMEKQFTKIEMIKAVVNPRLKHHLMDKYMYGFYSRQPIVANVKRDDTQYKRVIGQERSHVSFKQYREINAGMKEKYLEEYNRLKREGKIKVER